MLAWIKSVIARGENPARRRREPPDYDDVIGGCWGNAIYWFACDFEYKDFKVVGWKPFDQRPFVGAIIYAKMQRSEIWFEIVSIDFKNDPPDMFFADLRPVAQRMHGSSRLGLIKED